MWACLGGLLGLKREVDVTHKTTLPRSEKHCKVEGCKRPYRAKGYCNVHYRQWRKGLLPKSRIKKGAKKAEQAEG